MRVSSHSAYLLSHQNPSETINVERQLTERSVRSLPAASSRDEAEDKDDVPFLSDFDADVAGSLLPRDLDVDDDDEISLFLLSLTESREDVMGDGDDIPVQNGDSGESSFQATLPFTVATGPSLSSSQFSRCRRRVRFAPDSELVTVHEIPNRRSLTAEEKRSLYRDKRTLQAEKDRSCVEMNFERSLYCFENVLEEEYFFRNHLGELVHPAHWVAFVRDDWRSFARSRNPAVPPGFSSLREFVVVTTEYKRFFKTCVLENVFPTPEL